MWMVTNMYLFVWISYLTALFWRYFAKVLGVGYSCQRKKPTFPYLQVHEDASVTITTTEDLVNTAMVSRKMTAHSEKLGTIFGQLSPSTDFIDLIWLLVGR